jgi:tetratricopeptide (TPR) repeat protein
VDATEHSAFDLHELARALYRSGRRDLLETGEALARKATELDPESNQAWHTLAAILGRMGKWDEALSVVPRFLRPGKEARVEAGVIDFFIDAAAAGQAAPVLKLLVDSGAALELEPLVAALRMLLGEDLTIAAEIAEVANDVKLRIEQRRGNGKESEHAQLWRTVHPGFPLARE